MAQSGYTPILIYGSGTASNIPSAANLTSSANGAELALNYADGKLYYKNSAGTVTLLADKISVSVASANGFAGSVAQATATSTPAITISTSVTGVLVGNGTAVAAAVSGTDFKTINSTSILGSGNISITSTPGGATTQVQYNSAGAFAGSANLTFDGTSLTLGGNPTLSAGTANGVLYLNASKVATSGSALNYNGTSLGVGSSSYGVAGTINVAVGIPGTTTGGIQLWSTTTGAHSIEWGDGTTGSDQYRGYIEYAHSDDTMRFAVAATEQMRLTSTGLGIGTSSPAAKLTVQNDSVAVDIAVVGPSASQAGIRFGYSGATFQGRVLYDNSSNYMAFTTNGSERARITSGGNLGLGTTSPVSNGSTFATFSLNGSNGGAQHFMSGGSTIMQLYNDGNSFFLNASSGKLTIFQTAGTERVRISAAGGFSVGTTADPGAGAIYATGAITAYYSDARLKDVKGTITDALDKVSSLSGVYYTNNEVAVAHGYTSAETQVGLLAQDVEAVLPEVVKAAPFDLDEKGNSKSGEHYKTIQYERVIPLLVEAIKELRAEVQALRG